MSMAGKVRLSTSLRSRMISQLPVPLNSSKITSSMRDPVSIRAVATMVSEPPSSMLRAAPQGVGVHAAREHFARGRNNGVVCACQSGDGVEQDDDIALVLDQPLGF